MLEGDILRHLQLTVGENLNREGNQAAIVLALNDRAGLHQRDQEVALRRLQVGRRAGNRDREGRAASAIGAVRRRERQNGRRARRADRTCDEVLARIRLVKRDRAAGRRLRDRRNIIENRDGKCPLGSCAIQVCDLKRHAGQCVEIFASAGVLDRFMERNLVRVGDVLSAGPGDSSENFNRDDGGAATGWPADKFAQFQCERDIDAS